MTVLVSCDETSTVICLHIGSASTIPKTSDDAPLAVAMSATSFNAELAFADWLLSGHLARYSNLKIAFSESQIGWIPFVTERIDRIWRKGNAMSGMRPEIVDLPSSYISGRIYGCFFEDDFGVASRQAVGLDSITFESDYPHQDSTWPDTHHYLERILAGVPAHDAYKIARGTALQMLGLPDEPLPSAAHLAN
jgi:hypothetical protein